MDRKELFAEIRSFKPDLSWNNLKDYAVIVLGAFVQALALRFFLVPAQLVSGGVSGIAQLINAYVTIPIGTIILLGNLPLFVLGYRYLGTLRFALRTLVAVVFFALFMNLLGQYVPANITNDLILQALYGGVIYGVGSGIVYRGKGTSGGSDILCRILNHYAGISISQGYLIVDSAVVLAGLPSMVWWSFILPALPQNMWRKATTSSAPPSSSPNTPRTWRITFYKTWSVASPSCLQSAPIPTLSAPCCSALLPPLKYPN